MSWWAMLRRPDGGKAVEVPRHLEWGMLVEGGNDLAELNVTYNYGALFLKAGLSSPKGSLAMLDGMTGAEALEHLERAAKVLTTMAQDEGRPDPSDSGGGEWEDHWEATPANAPRVLKVMASWSRQHPDAVWDIG